MVKGVSRQVIVVRQPEAKLFEQAIFLLREDALKDGVSDEQLLKQAHQAADTYLENAKVNVPWLHRKLMPGLLWMGGGAGLTGLIWLLTVLF